MSLRLDPSPAYMLSCCYFKKFALKFTLFNSHCSIPVSIASVPIFIILQYFIIRCPNIYTKYSDQKSLSGSELLNDMI